MPTEFPSQSLSSYFPHRALSPQPWSIPYLCRAQSDGTFLLNHDVKFPDDRREVSWVKTDCQSTISQEEAVLMAVI
ncbi:hypothetical protein K435DRAFT_779844 [Dendrothele bispora CBS 962.96]|uniref:Uncharacterized protein n=1 Tax=Dendrothele bispora (strain CBS 962.96) TaxID=1314807 RepID=A0A4S8LWA4_DENBC|nr:hypothetical protein K435DRAFT_779844 [Dendrothele bispora CBS 962.96]